MGLTMITAATSGLSNRELHELRVMMLQRYDIPWQVQALRATLPAITNREARRGIRLQCTQLLRRDEQLRQAIQALTWRAPHAMEMPPPKPAGNVIPFPTPKPAH